VSTPSDEIEQMILGRDDTFSRVLGLYDTPAYVRRGLRVEESRERVLRRCESVRDEYLRWVRVQLAALRGTASDWRELRAWLESEDDRRIVAELVEQLLPLQAAATIPRTALWRRGSILREFIASLQRFNERWDRFVGTVDLREANAAVDAYNRFYLLEKECAMRSPRLAAKGFQPAQPLTRDELMRKFPPLPVPRLRR
jgi:hypothetical protein